MDHEKVILTPAGHQKLVDELTFLKTKKRREVADQLAEARAHGDLRENAEYDAAKNAKQHLETQIAKLELRLSRAKIVDPAEIAHDKAYLGAKLKIKNLNTGDTFEYSLVAQDEANLDEGKISVTSPIGKGLLGKGKDEVAEIQVPAGKLQFQVLEISYDL